MTRYLFEQNLPTNRNGLKHMRLEALIIFAIIALVTALEGCSRKDSEADLRACMERIPVSEGRKPLTEEEHDAAGAEIAECMKALGYRHDLSGSKCLDDVDFNSACYVERRR